MLLNTVFSNATRNVTMLLGMVACTVPATAQTQFLITSVSSGQALDVTDSSKTPGGSIQQSVPTVAANQLWTMHRHGDSFSYEIVSVNSGLVLDVAGSSTKPGAYIQQDTATGGNNQLWHFARVGGATGYEIIATNQEELPGFPGSLATYANLVLDVPNFSTKPGIYIQQSTANGGTNQQWIFNARPSGNFLTGFQFNGIDVSGGNSYTVPITVAGGSFAAGSEVCPVFVAASYTWSVACATVASNGTFSYEVGPPSGFQFSGPGGYTVVIIEDKNQNVLAIGSAATQLFEVIK
jgi:hypothetical protein